MKGLILTGLLALPLTTGSEVTHDAPIYGVPIPGSNPTIFASCSKRHIYVTIRWKLDARGNILYKYQEGPCNDA